MIAYETGVASSPSDLLAKLETFAEAHGWTAEAASGGGRVFWNGTGATVFAGVLAAATTWTTRGALSFNGALAYNAQPNNAGRSHVVTFGAGPFVAYHFFVGDEDGHDYMHVVVEILPGQYRHWALGTLIKAGAFTGGTYSDSTHLQDDNSNRNVPESTAHRHVCDAFSQNTDAHVWVDYDTKSNNWQSVIGVNQAFLTTQCVGSSRGGLTDSLFARMPQQWNLRTSFVPLTYFANRASGLRSPIGRIPNMRWVNLTNFSPAQLLTVGGDDWQVFPVFKRQTAAVANTEVSSQLYGYAHKRP